MHSFSVKREGGMYKYLQNMNFSSIVKGNLVDYYYFMAGLFTL